MDEREMIKTAISHINNAKSAMQQFPTSGLSKKSMAELDMAFQALDDSINHFNGIFGPATGNNPFQNNTTLR